jgi:uncharacterized protein
MCVNKKKIPCPECRKRIDWKDAPEFKPFCSERCKLFDLGKWADDGHVISD